MIWILVLFLQGNIELQKNKKSTADWGCHHVKRGRIEKPTPRRRATAHAVNTNIFVNDAIEVDVNTENNDISNNDVINDENTDNQDSVEEGIIYPSGRGGKERGKGRGRGRGRGTDNTDDILICDRCGCNHTTDDENCPDIGWVEEPTPPETFPFTGKAKLNITIPKTFLQFVQVFITYELLQYLTIETNNYAQYCYDTDKPKCKSSSAFLSEPCNVKEMAQFLGLRIAMGFICLPAQHMYWQRNSIHAIHSFITTMKYKRFQLIGKYFHTFNREAIPINNVDRLILVRPLLEYLRKRGHEVYEPEVNLSLDEGILPFKGHLSFKVYNPKKPNKYGIKFYILCESKSGYVLDFMVYTGTHNTLEHIIGNLMNRYYGKGYRLYMDNYYNSVHIVDKLYGEKVHVVGTLRLNRGAPVVLKKLSQKGGIKLDRDTLQYRRRNNTFIICWQDQRLVSMITSLHGPATEKIQSKKRVRTKENVSSVEVTDLPS